MAVNGVVLRTNRKSGGALSLLLDSLIVFIISAGFSLLVFPTLPFDYTALEAVLMSATVTAAVILLSRKWFFAAVGAGGVLIVVTVYGIIAAGNSFLPNLKGFFVWWAELYPEESGYWNGLSFFAVKLLLVLIIVSAVTAVIRKLKNVLPLFIGLIAVYFWLVVESYGISIAGLILAVTGLLAASAGNVYLSKGRFFSDRKENSTVKNNLTVRIAALATALVCVAASLIIVPVKVTHTVKSEQLAAKIQQATGIYSYDQKNLDSFGLNKLGLQPNSVQLGGNIYPVSERRMLKVYSKYSTLMKAYVCSNYDGYTWNEDNSEMYVLNDPEMRAKQNIAFGTYNYSEEVRALLDEVAYKNYITVYNLTPSRLLYTPMRMLSFSERSFTGAPLRFNMASELLSFRYMPENYSYEMDSLVQINSANKAKVYSAVEKELANSNDSLYFSEGFLEKYTQLPSNYSNRAATLAKSVTEPYGGVYEKLSALETYFKYSNLYTYTTTPGDVPQGREFVDYFLQTKRGYCVYFATAMATMARSLGYPSRIVSGYGMTQDDESSWVCLEKYAHCWIECYIKGLGWISFDPTPSQNYTACEDSLIIDNEHMPGKEDTVKDTKYEDQVLGEADPDNLDTEAETPGYENITPNKVNTVSNGSLPIGTVRAIIFGCAFLLITLIVLIIVKCNYSSKKFYPENVRKNRNNTEQAEYYYKDILKQARLLGFTVRNGESMNDFALRLKNDKPDVFKEDTLTVFEIMTALRYGHIEPSDEDVQSVSSFHSSCESWVKGKLGGFRYVIVRRIFD